jgi:hypothetical protein
MKKISLLLLAIASFGMVQAQTEKGDWMVGGGFRLNTSDDNTEITLNPTAGAFVINNLALGANFSFSYSKTGSNKATIFGIGPFARYYFTQAQVRPIVHGQLNYISQQLKITGFPSNTSSGLNYFLGGGAAIFLNDQVSLDALLGYDHAKLKDFDGSGGFAMTIGFQVYLKKQQVDRVRGK